MNNEKKKNIITIIGIAVSAIAVIVSAIITAGWIPNPFNPNISTTENTGNEISDEPSNEPSAGEVPSSAETSIVEALDDAKTESDTSTAIISSTSALSEETATSTVEEVDYSPYVEILQEHSESILRLQYDLRDLGSNGSPLKVSTDQVAFADLNNDGIKELLFVEKPSGEEEDFYKDQLNIYSIINGQAICIFSDPDFWYEKNGVNNYCIYTKKENDYPSILKTFFVYKEEGISSSREYSIYQYDFDEDEKIIKHGIPAIKIMEETDDEGVTTYYQIDPDDTRTKIQVSDVDYHITSEIPDINTVLIYNFSTIHSGDDKSSAPNKLWEVFKDQEYVGGSLEQVYTDVNGKESLLSVRPEGSNIPKSNIDTTQFVISDIDRRFLSDQDITNLKNLKDGIQDVINNIYTLNYFDYYGNEKTQQILKSKYSGYTPKYSVVAVQEQFNIYESINMDTLISARNNN